MAAAPAPGTDDFPWWLVAVIALGLLAATGIYVSDIYSEIFSTVITGLGITLRVTLVAFALASALGLVFALMSLSGSIFLRQTARFYIEIVRGLPILLILFYIAFVGAPAIVSGLNMLLSPLIAGGLMKPIAVRDVSLEARTVVALMIGYSAFLAEVFRAGIQAVDAGQIEAAKSLGLTGYQRFRLVVAPQALRTIFPPYSNDFIAMLKDSSLVSVLGVADIMQMAKIASASNFRYFETYNIAAFIYLILTIGLSIFLRRIERRMRDQRTTAPEH